MIRDAPLSEHFRVREIFTDGPDPDRFELFLARRLCRGPLETLRDIAQEPVEVTDGRRLFGTHERYVNLKYKPSLTTDHAFGFGFLSAGGTDSGQTASMRLFPGAWFVGLGAADVKPLHKGKRRNWTTAEFDKARIELFCAWPEDDAAHPSECACLAGQLIMYPVRGHIHVSNPYTVLFDAQAIRGLGLPTKRGPAYVYPE